MTHTLRTPIVYTMGKVASSAISRAIRSTGQVVHDIHTLNDEHLRREAMKALEAGRFPNPHICVSMAWKEREIVTPQRAVYISLVRDPIGRNISAYFQNRSEEFAEASTHPDGAERLVQGFLDGYNHQFPINWFDREFKRYLGLDVFNFRFRKDVRYQLSHHERIVIFRVDATDEIKSRVLSRVLGYKVSVDRVNDSANKSHREMYDAVKRLARFRSDVLDPIYDSPFARHFWTPDEIEDMRSRWLVPNSQV